MSEVTQILQAIEQGDPHAAHQLLPLVYDELRRLASRQLSSDARGRHCKPPPSSIRRGCRSDATHPG